MTYRNSQQALRALYAVATSQGGYFTAKQAAAAGYGKRHVDYHVKRGSFERVGHGLYRLPTVPISEHDELIRLSLWSRGRDDRPQAVVSHATALGLHQLGDVLPIRVHLTVPPTFRKTVPPGSVLHQAVLGPEDIQEWTGFSVTSPQRTLLDAATERTVTQEQLDRAVREALNRGLVRRSWVRSVAREFPNAAGMLRTEGLRA